MAAPFGVVFSLGGIVLEMDPVRGTRGSGGDVLCVLLPKGVVCMVFGSGFPHKLD